MKKWERAKVAVLIVLKGASKPMSAKDIHQSLIWFYGKGVIVFAATQLRYEGKIIFDANGKYILNNVINRA